MTGLVTPASHRPGLTFFRLFVTEQSEHKEWQSEHTSTSMTHTTTVDMDCQETVLQEKTVVNTHDMESHEDRTTTTTTTVVSRTCEDPEAMEDEFDPYVSKLYNTHSGVIHMLPHAAVRCNQGNLSCVVQSPQVSIHQESTTAVSRTETPQVQATKEDAP